MNFQLRQHHLLAALEQHGSLEVADMARQLQTTPITIRRDLAQLAAQGLVLRTHGGAVLPRPDKAPVAFARKAAAQQAQKEHICRVAAGQVADGDTLFIDCGSTTFPLCALIRHRRVRVVTNSLPVVFELLDSAVQLILAGGEIDAARQAAHGLVAAEHLRRYQVDKAFIGVDGFSLARGLTANSEHEAAITLAAAGVARRVFLLCDASKLEQDKFFQFASPALVHTLITDPAAPAELLARYRQAGLTVLT